MNKNQGKTKQQANENHDKQRMKSHQQRQLSQSKHPYDLSRFDGEVVSTLEFEFKDPSSTLGRTSYEFIFDAADYS